MTSTHSSGGLRPPVLIPDWLRGTGFAYLYWVVFLIALEPGNILRARGMGHSLDFETEILRIAVAALLGCSTAPLSGALARRFPLTGARAWQHIAIHAGAAAVLSAVLILVSCVLVAWIFQGQALPSPADVRGQLAANLLLLSFVICAFAFVCHARKGSAAKAAASSMASAASKASAAGNTSAIAIKTRGRLGYLDLASIEWIESQGNYLALHAGGRTHLVREALRDFAGRLDANRFIQVHRRVIVAIDRVREIQPLPNGDSTLLLVDGGTLRASRSYRAALRQRWADHHRPAANS
jgi:two-component system, LytTR family, response regulator